jgi:DNA-directed RNA polymerase specialized sigma24 family protein
MTLSDGKNGVSCCGSQATRNGAGSVLFSFMSEKQSVTGWIDGLKASDEEAARALWRRYFEKLVALARRRLVEGPRRVADEEDVALSVFKSLCEGAERGEFDHLNDREDLWRLLVTITVRKADQHTRWHLRQKRGGRKVRGESVFLNNDSGFASEGFDGLPGSEPTPEFLVQLRDEHQRLLNLLADDTLRRIAAWKMEGRSNAQMAADLGVTTRSVERKVQRIRETWKTELRRE